jgi:hypothetical protein
MKKCEKRIPALVLVITVFVALGCLAPAAGAQTPLLSVDPDSVIVSDGTAFTLDIVISAEATELMGYNIAVVFDSDVIELSSVNEGSLPLTSGYTTFFYSYDTGAADSVHVNGAILGNTVDGPGVLFTLEFEATPANGVEETDVDIAYSVLRTGVNEDIVHDVQHGYVRVVTPVRTEVVTWGVVKGLYRDTR